MKQVLTSLIQFCGWNVFSLIMMDHSRWSHLIQWFCGSRFIQILSNILIALHLLRLPGFTTPKEGAAVILTFCSFVQMSSKYTIYSICHTKTLFKNNILCLNKQDSIAFTDEKCYNHSRNLCVAEDYTKHPAIILKKKGQIFGDGYYFLDWKRFWCWPWDGNHVQRLFSGLLCKVQEQKRQHQGTLWKDLRRRRYLVVFWKAIRAVFIRVRCQYCQQFLRPDQRFYFRVYGILASSGRPTFLLGYLSDFENDYFCTNQFL